MDSLLLRRRLMTVMETLCFEKEYEYPSSQSPDDTFIVELYYVEDTETYRSNPMAVAEENCAMSRRAKQTRTLNLIYSEGSRLAFGMTVDGNGRKLALCKAPGGSFGWNIEIIDTSTGTSYTTIGQFPMTSFNYTYQTSYTGRLSTNIPFFESSDDASAYVNAATEEEALEVLRRAVNFRV